tara:strand:- start:281 stop:556 length:276 start_codon:yes stop_codon:yes gene_type:complete
MQRLKTAIKEAVKETGIEKALKQESAVFLWEEVVGKTVSTVTEAKKVENGILLIKTQSPTWRQELYMQKENILNKINRKIGSRAIKEIRFI